MGLPVINGEVLSEWFPAVITSVGSLVTSGGCSGYPHAWTQLVPCNKLQNHEDRADIQKNTGTLANSPAYCLDGSAATVGDVVLMRYYGQPEGDPVYQFLRFSGGSGSANVARVKIITPVSPGDPNGRLQTYVGGGSPWVDGSDVYVVEINGHTVDLPVGQRFLAHELEVAGVYGVALDPTAVISVVCDAETGLYVQTRA